MNATSASPAEGKVRILVWDAPVRVFHWLMVACFAGAYLTAETERWRLVHVTLGYTLGGLVLFRLLWGVVGTRYARFAQFVRGPGNTLRYLRSMLTRQPDHHTGHNPAGAIAILALLGLSLAVTFSGWALYNEFGPEGLEDVHEVAANVMLAVIGFHVLGVVYGSWAHGENLVRAMVTGYKTGQPQDGVRRAWFSVAALMLVAVAAFWTLQWQDAPGSNGAGAADTAALPALDGRGRHDDDGDDD